VGILFEPREDLRLGIVYQSKTELRLSGSTKGSGPLGGGVSTDLDLDLPRAVRGDVRWQAFDRVALSFGGAWEQWDGLQNTRLRLGSSGSRDVRFAFKDTYKLRGGIHYQLNHRTLLQTGVSYDSSVLRNKDRIAAFPVDEQWRWGIGGTYDWSEGTRIGYAFQWTHLGDAKLRGDSVKGEYEKNELFFFVVTLNFSKLPWDGMASF
jgi:long-chain fatty acid transport protein